MNFVLIQANLLIVQEDYHTHIFYYEFYQDIPMFPTKNIKIIDKMINKNLYLNKS